jgi:hypothetical protein
MIRLLLIRDEPVGPAVPPRFSDVFDGALMRYVHIPLPVISGGKPGIVYSAFFAFRDAAQE